MYIYIYTRHYPLAIASASGPPRISITDLYDGIILLTYIYITESYCEIILWMCITELYYGMIAWSYITKSCYGLILWDCITEFHY